MNTNIKEYINKEIAKLHKKTLLESELKTINSKLKVLKEEDESNDKNDEQKAFESNVYESYKKDLGEVVSSLAEACNKLETSALKQESHIKNLPEVAGRMDEGKKHKDVILEIFKEVKKAKIAAERKLYEMR